MDDLLDSLGDKPPVQQVTIPKKELELLSEEKLLENVSRAVDVLMEKMGNDFGKAAVVARTLLEIKKAWYPATNKNVNTNINIFDSKLEAWRRENAEFIKMEEERAKNLMKEGIQIENREPAR